MQIQKTSGSPLIQSMIERVAQGGLFRDRNSSGGQSPDSGVLDDNPRATKFYDDWAKKNPPMAHKSAIHAMIEKAAQVASQPGHPR
jgi:hypothetical protein